MTNEAPEWAKRVEELIYPKMDPDVKAEWVAALRSGEFVQGRFNLCRNDQYCCLGVLYDVAVDGEWEAQALEASGLHNGERWGIPYVKEVTGSKDVNGGNLPAWVLDKVGLAFDAHNALVRMNDANYNKWPFERIADWIDENL